MSIYGAKGVSGRPGEEGGQKPYGRDDANSHRIQLGFAVAICDHRVRPGRHYGGPDVTGQDLAAGGACFLHRARDRDRARDLS